MHTILYAALRSRLAYQIQKALCSELCPELSLNRRDRKEQEFPLKQIRPSQLSQLKYVSAVALKYAPTTGRSPLQLAEDLAQILVTECSRTGNNLNSETTWHSASHKASSLSSEHDPIAPDDPQFCLMSWFQIEIVPAGWIYFRLLPAALSDWLQFLLDSALPRLSESSNLSQDAQSHLTAASACNSIKAFPILHTCARCHSFLRLGQQLGLIEGRLGGSADRDMELELEPEPELELEPDSLWQIQQPHPLPWLLPDGSFRSSHPAEWQLVEQICATLDGMVEVEIWSELGTFPDCQAVLKQADRLSRTWQTFYAACRIADGTQHLDPAQAQVRLGLTCITQKLLHGLLRSIGLPTPLFL